MRSTTGTIQYLRWTRANRISSFSSANMARWPPGSSELVRERLVGELTSDRSEIGVDGQTQPAGHRIAGDESNQEAHRRDHGEVEQTEDEQAVHASHVAGDPTPDRVQRAQHGGPQQRRREEAGCEQRRPAPDRLEPEPAEREERSEDDAEGEAEAPVALARRPQGCPRGCGPEPGAGCDTVGGYPS